MSRSYNCPACLQNGKIIYYSAQQEVCAVCGHSPLLLSLVRSDDTRPPTVTELLRDPACSQWLKQALTTGLARDPVDAANDADVLAAVLDSHCRRVLDEG